MTPTMTTAKQEPCDQRGLSLCQQKQGHSHCRMLTSLFQGRASACSLQHPWSGKGSSRSLCCSEAFHSSPTALGSQTSEGFSNEALSLHWRFWSTTSHLLQCHTSSLTHPHDIYCPAHSFLGNFRLIQPQKSSLPPPFHSSALQTR